MDAPGQFNEFVGVSQLRKDTIWIAQPKDIHCEGHFLSASMEEMQKDNS
jgi:hypothetical protein